MVLPSFPSALNALMILFAALVLRNQGGFNLNLSWPLGPVVLDKSYI